MTQTHSLQIFGVIPFVKLQNNTWATVKWWKMVKNDAQEGTTLYSLGMLTLSSSSVESSPTRMLTYCDTDTQSANFQSNPLCQAPKQHLSNS